MKQQKSAPIAVTALFTALICVCSWVQIPSAVPFTLQTFAVFTAAGFLGAKKCVAATLAYILIGCAGVPVFSGFRSGPGVLFGNTGGYIFGFILSALAVGFAADKLGRSVKVLIPSMLGGLALCYAVGTAWFALMYANGGIKEILTACVLPFIIPDLLKILLSSLLVQRLSVHLKNKQ